MSLVDRARVHAALGDVARLRIVDLLVESDRSVQELASATEMPGNLLAHHLNVLQQAGLIERHRSEGDRRRHYVTLHRSSLDGLAVDTTTPGSVAFICSHNSARSQYAAAYWRSKTGRPAQSAGLEPARVVHPTAIRVARERGIDLSKATPAGYASLIGRPEWLVTVCDRARENALPEAHAHSHWSIPDPAAEGNVTAFRSAFDQIEMRVDALVQ
jgi:protein-tyrosine-phosphatase